MPTYYNPTDQPVIADADGRMVPGRDRATLDGRTPEVKAAVERGDLVKLDDPAKPAKSTDSKE